MANVNNAGGGTIDFNIGTGTQVIKLQSTLPSIVVSSFTIDGTTEADYTGTPLINIDGSQAGAGSDCLNLAVGTLTIKGLSITNFGAIAISEEGSTSGTISNNYLGVEPDGITPAGNGNAGLLLWNGASNLSVAANVVSGNGFNGLHSGIDVDGANNNIFVANFLGTDAAGDAAIPNADHGIALFGGSSENDIGGSGQGGSGNIISGNNGYGIEMFGSASFNTISANFIGTNSGGSSSLGTQLAGIHLSDNASHNVIGTNQAGNVIAFNHRGVVIEGAGTVGNTILNNRIYGNLSLGIDLGNDGVTPNQPSGSGSGPNNLQNFPVLTSVDNNSFPTVVNGTLKGTPGTTYELEFFSNDPNDPARQGQFLANTQNVTADSSGNADFAVQFFSEGPFDASNLTATATNLTTGDTSEFSARHPTTSPPAVR